MFLEAVEFAGVELAVAPGQVMRPRSTSERLVDRTLEWIGERPARIVDVGTGSGALAVAIALRAPAAEVWATDVDPAAVMLARLNARVHGVPVTVRRGDLLMPLGGRFDVIVANLPYLPWRERARHRDLLREPRHAVFAGGDGLGHLRRLLGQARSRLAPGGLVLLQLRGRMVELTAGDLEAAC